MTDRQVLALTDREVDKLVNLRKAKDGIKLMVLPVEPDYEEKIEKDCTFYKIRNLNNFLFIDRAVAGELADGIKKHLKGAYYARYSHNPQLISKLDVYDQREAEVTLEEEKFYSPAVMQEAGAINKRNSSAREAYEKLKSEYDKYVEDTQWIIDEIWDKVLEVRRKYQTLAALQIDYKEYLVLADGDEKIATAFLKKANPLSDEELKVVKGKKIVTK